MKNQQFFRGARQIYVFRFDQDGKKYKEVPYRPKFDRDSVAYRDFRTAVLVRDHSRCVLCSSMDHVHVHHLKGWMLFPMLRYEPPNGVTLCKKCHDKHYGYQMRRAFPSAITTQLQSYNDDFYAAKRQERLAKFGL